MSESESNPTSAALENQPEALAAPPAAKAGDDAPTSKVAVAEEPSTAEVAEADAPTPEAAVAASDEDTDTTANAPAESVTTAETAQVDPTPAATEIHAADAAVPPSPQPAAFEATAEATEDAPSTETTSEDESAAAHAAQTMVETAGEIMAAVRAATGEALEAARETAEKMTEKAGPAIRSVSETVTPAAEAAAKTVSDAVAPVVEAVTEKASEVAHAVQAKAGEAAAAASAAVAGEPKAADGKAEEAKTEEEMDPTVIMLREAKDNETPVEGRVIGWNQGGFHVVIETVTAFCPRSEMEIKNPRSPSYYVDKTFEFRVIKHQKKGRRIVLSRKALLMEDRAGTLTEIEQAVTTGETLTGRVSSLTDFGAFVDLGGIEGLVHVTEIDHTRVNHPKDRLQMGQEVKVKVLKVENGGDRISLSMKSLQDNPWSSFADEHPRGSQFEGKVVRKTDFGLFVELQPGMDGMVHLSQLPPGKKLDDYQEGETLEGWVLRTEPGRERISLSLKEVPEGDPWQNVRERYPEGETVEGEVEEVAPFGVFVTLEPGLTGLLPNSSLNVRRGQDASRMFPAGQKIQVQVDSVDLQRKRISLAQEGQRLAGSRHDYKDYQKRQKQETTTGMGAMAAAFAKLQDQDEA